MAIRQEMAVASQKLHAHRQVLHLPTAIVQVLSQTRLYLLPLLQGSNSFRSGRGLSNLKRRFALFVFVEDICVHVPQKVEAVDASVLSRVRHCCATNAVLHVHIGSTTFDEHLSR